MYGHCVITLLNKSGVVVPETDQNAGPHRLKQHVPAKQPKHYNYKVGFSQF